MSFNYLSYANIPYMPYLPCGMTNFGGDIQVFTLPDDITSGPVGMYLNPQALQVLSQQQCIWNNWGANAPSIGTTTTPITGTTTGSTSSTGNMFIDAMLNMVKNSQIQKVQSSATSTLNGIKNLRNQFYAQLYKSGITEEEAAKINDNITKLNEEEQKLTKAVEDKQKGNIDDEEFAKVVAESAKNVNNITAEIANEQNISAFLKNMDKTMEKVESVEKRTDLTETQKKRLQELKTKLEEIKTKIEKLKENPDKLEPAEINTELVKLNSEYNAIASAISQISAASAASSTTPADKTGSGDKAKDTKGTDKTKDTKGTDKAKGSDKAKGTKASDKSKKTTSSAAPATDSEDDVAGNVPAQLPEGSAYSSDGKAIADMFYDGDMDEACKKITKDNVIDVMLAWQDLYSTEFNQSFMERFIDKAGYSQKREIGKIIKNALVDKSLELNVHDKCREDFAKIGREVRSTFWFDNDVAKNYDNVIRIIAQKEGKKYVETPKS